GQKLAFLFGNAEPFERALDVFGHFIPTTFGRGAGRKIITDFVEIDRLQILARPMRRERFLQESFQPAQTKFADPVRIFFDVGNVMNRLLAQADTGVLRVIDLVMEIAFVPVDIDRFGFCFHCRSYLSTASDASSRVQSSPRSSSSRASSLRPLRTIRPATITWTWSGMM